MTTYDRIVKEGFDKGFKIGMKEGLKIGLQKQVKVWKKLVLVDLIQKHPDWTDHELAEIVEVSVQFVFELKAQIKNNNRN